MTLLWFIHFSNLSCRHGYLVCLASLLFPWWPKCFLLFPFQCHPDSVATTCRQGEYASVRGSVVLRASRRLSQIWMHATQLQIVCVFVGVHVCACVRLLSHTSGLGGPRHTHTHTDRARVEQSADRGMQEWLPVLFVAAPPHQSVVHKGTTFSILYYF